MRAGRARHGVTCVILGAGALCARAFTLSRGLIVKYLAQSLANVVPVKRAGAVKVEFQPVELGGNCAFDGKKAVRLQVPKGPDMLSRYIRCHELLHAKYTPHKRDGSTQPAQALEDCLNNGPRYPRDISLRRARMYYAVAGLRELYNNRDKIPDLPLKEREKVLTQLLGYAPVIVDALTHYTRLLRRFSYVCDTLGVDSSDAFTFVCSPSDRPKDYGPQLDRLRALYDCLAPDAENNWDKTDPGDVDASEGDEKEMPDDRMTIVEPTRDLPCATGLTDEIEPRRMGMRMSMRHAVNEVICPLGRPLFREYAIRPGFSGTVLVDASGSMGWNESTLSRFCELCPGALVAYYSGGRGKGNLVIAARDGRRIGSITHKMGGNEIDLPAMRWLHRQQGPHVYIGDGGFCGVCFTSSHRMAAEMLANRCELWLRHVCEALTWAEDGAKI